MKRVRVEELPEKYKSQDQENETSSEDGENEDAWSPSLFDQSMVNWQGLQEWAQKQWAKRYENSANSSLNNIKPRPPVEEVRLPADIHLDSPPPQYQTLEGVKDPATHQTGSGQQEMMSQETGSSPAEVNSSAEPAQPSASGMTEMNDLTKKSPTRDQSLFPWQHADPSNPIPKSNPVERHSSGDIMYTSESQSSKLDLLKGDHVQAVELGPEVESISKMDPDRSSSRSSVDTDNGPIGLSKVTDDYISPVKSEKTTQQTMEDVIKQEILKYGDPPEHLDRQLKYGLSVIPQKLQDGILKSVSGHLKALPKEIYGRPVHGSDSSMELTDTSSEGKSIPENPAPSSIESDTTGSEKSLPQKSLEGIDATRGEKEKQKPQLEHQTSHSSHASTQPSDSNHSSSSQYYPVLPRAPLSENSSEQCQYDYQNMVTMEMHRGNRSSLASSGTKRSYSLKEYITSQKCK